MPTAEKLQSAVTKAIGFFAGFRGPHALLWLVVMHRRFGIGEFADALQRFDEMLSEPRPDLAQLRVFRRIADPDNPLQVDDLESISHSSDRIVVSALYCDQLELPPVFPEVLAKAVKAGGYYTTHALLACIWIQEYGDAAALPRELVDEIYRATAGIVNEDPKTVSDLRLEAAAFLYLAGHGHLIDDAFLDTIIVTQNSDGGWGLAREDEHSSDWHATILGLLLLLHVRSRDADA